MQMFVFDNGERDGDGREGFVIYHVREADAKVLHELSAHLDTGPSLAEVDARAHSVTWVYPNGDVTCHVLVPTMTHHYPAPGHVTDRD